MLLLIFSTTLALGGGRYNVIDMFFNLVMNLKKRLRTRWQHPQGYALVLRVSLPLIVGMASSTIMMVTDRIFLANYSLEAVAAAMPAGILAFVPTSFFMGVCTYANVFIAHYYGARAKHRIGPALWQGIYFALLSGLLMIAISFSADFLFALGGHPPEVQELEKIYFTALTLGGGFNVIMAVLGCFYSGQGITRPIMVINIIGMLLNVPLNYLMINGLGPFPEMGIFGAALATVISWIVECLLFAFIIFSRANLDQFNLRPSWPERDLLKRLWRFGLPSGLQFVADVATFTLFVFLVGRMGLQALAANNIVFSLNQIAFVPVLGLNVGISTLVGQSLGARNTQAAQEVTASAMHLAFLYMLGVALWFVLAPLPLLELFRPREMAGPEFTAISRLGVELLRLVAIYCIFDSFTIIYSGALRGAGDTRFVMLAMLITSLTIMIAPTILAVYMDWGIKFTWYCMTVYISVLGIIYYKRFKSGVWKSIQVVETTRV